MSLPNSEEVTRGTLAVLFGATLLEQHGQQNRNLGVFYVFMGVPGIGMSVEYEFSRAVEGLALVGRGLMEPVSNYEWGSVETLQILHELRAEYRARVLHN